MPLDFLLFLGSAQSFFNEARRSAYAAGCCFVDAYARLIQQRVTFPVHVINWGFWSHSFDLPIQQTMRAAGLGVIQAQDGMPAIERVLAAGPIQAGFLKADFRGASSDGHQSSRATGLPARDRERRARNRARGKAFRMRI